jgi:4-hydroxy-tetrahydrodipicolinate synthase
LELDGAGGILVASHLVGPQMREMWDAAQAGEMARAREIDSGLRQLYDVLGITTNPIPLKAALEMTGLIPSGGLRLPLVEADAQQRAAVRAALEAAGVAVVS